MEQELGKLIDHLVSQGASDEEIDIVVKDFQANHQNAWQRGAKAAENVPFGMAPVARGIYDAGRAVSSVVTDMIPQMASSLQLKGASTSQKELEGVIARNPELANKRGGVLGIGQTPAEGLAAAQAAAPKFEADIQQQKADAQYKLAGATQDFKDINSVTSLGSYVGQAIGQALGQIPLSAATGGASSFLMEAATVYDEQLDLLAKKHGISREEVVRRGLDKPIEGEVYAMLAGGLDAVSAGSIMKLFKGVASKEIKESAMKTFLKGALGEGVTEGAQGIAEQFGAESGAGVDNPIDWHSVANDALAGAIGGGGLSMATSRPEEHAIHIQDENKFLGVESTGDPHLDAAIDAMTHEAKLDADFIEKTTADDAIVPKGVQDDIVTNLNKTLEEERKMRKVAEDKVFRHEFQAALDAAPTVNPPHPSTEENDLGPGVDAVSTQKAIALNPLPVKFELTPRKEGKKTINDYSYTDEAGGRASGSISGNTASIIQIYAAPDGVENPQDFKGRGFYQKVLDQLKKQGVTEVVVAVPSADSQAALSKLVERGVLTNPRDFADKENKVPTRFDIPEASVEQLGIQRDAKIKAALKTEVNPEFVPESELVKHENPRELRIAQKELKKEYLTLKSLLECLAH